MSSVVEKRYYTSQISKISDDEVIRQLFDKVPESSIDAYKKTLIYNSTKEYVKSNKMLMANFFHILDKELRKSSPLRVYKKYENEFEKMENFFNIEKKYFVDLLKRLSSNNGNAKYKAVEEIWFYIRDYNSKSRGHFFKCYNKEKISQLYNISYKKEQQTSNKDLENYSFLSFIEDLAQDKPYTYGSILELMSNASNIVIDDIIQTTFEFINDNKPINDFLNIFGIYKPINYDPNYIKNCKITNRLRDNFEKILNKESDDSNYKKLLVEYINNKSNDVDTSKIESKISIKDKINAQVICPLLKRVKGIASIKNNHIYLSTPIIIDKYTIDKFKKYEQHIYDVNYFIKYCLKLYHNELKRRNENSKFNSNDNINNLLFDDNSYEINAESFIHYSKVSNLIMNIDKEKLHNLSEEELNSLKRLLNDEYLLFTYLIGNIELEDILLIINNYSGIVSYLNKYNIKFSDLDNLLKVSKTLKYVNDLEIALIGYDNIVKIINYNQFSGVDVTDDIIRKRIHKAVYLSVNSEKIKTSSLPYDVDVNIGNLKLKRYLNNDPELLVSGIETKTCFFISVNENDFFFYSLLNKNGFVVKIVDEKDNFIARASCFRRNNILMINGIRLKNNDINPKNREQEEIMSKVVRLIELMSEKIIYSTSADDCPIDYVVCNKSGILENSKFEDRYELVDFKIIREPINIYSDDYKEFVEINKRENDEDLLQEAPINPNKSFTTDFGDNYSLVLVKSRRNMGLLKPRDVSLKDQDSIYTRPKSHTRVYTAEEIDNKTLEKVNRMRALKTFSGYNQEERQKDFKLLNNLSNVSKVIVATDWVGVIYNDDTYEFAYSELNLEISNEIQKYASFKTGDSNPNKPKKLLFKKN